MATTRPGSIGFQRETTTYISSSGYPRNRVEETMSQMDTIQRLDGYLKQFYPLDETRDLGIIEKIELDSGSKLVLKADYHGDSIGLEKYLEGLKAQGYLDENFNIAEEYKGKIVIAFLGDYMDRGENSFKVLDRLLELKMNNPDEIVLLRGNHENVAFSANYLNERERYFYTNEDLCKKLQKVFTTMPLACLVGNQNDRGKYEYTLLTHGAIDPDIDLNRLLNTPSKRFSIVIRRDKTADLSDRIQDILPDSLKSKKSSLEFADEMQTLKEFINEQSEKNLSKVKSLLGITSIDKKQAKLFLSILNVKDFLYNPFFILEQYLPKRLQNLSLSDIELAIKLIKEALAINSKDSLQPLAERLKLEFSDIRYFQKVLNILLLKSFPNLYLSILSNEKYTICNKMKSERAKGTTGFNWGDIDGYILGVNNDRRLALKLTPKFLKDYFRAVSTDNRKVKTLRTGHAHKHQQFRLRGKKIAETLPVSGGLEMFRSVTYGSDHAQIITINGKAKTWLEQSFTRYFAEETFQISEPRSSFYQKDAL